jgi:ribonucleoside-triphosphate reductase
MTDVCLINFSDYAAFRLPTLYQQQTHLTKYSRYRTIDGTIYDVPFEGEPGRRETWPETVFRFCHFMFNHIYRNFGYYIPYEYQIKIYEGILFLHIMPSMRAMMTAGPALERDNAAAYNCAYSPVDRVSTHIEAFYMTMCSCGVGFSVERQYTNQLPLLPDSLQEIDYCIVVEDDKIGWCEAYEELLSLLYIGKIPKWDTSKIRPKGARLMTFGGRASGPGPLIDLFEYTVNLFKEAVQKDQKRLTSYDNHDLMTKASDVANAGGVRRGAMISLSNPSDLRMRDAKSGQWWIHKPHFRLANDSNVWTDYPDALQFADEWLALIRSQSGERGQISRQALIDQARRARRIDVDKWGEHYGLNPCGEIILRPRQFCNLTTNIIRADDTLEHLLRKIELSTIIGTMQSTLTNFRFLSSDWKFNCEEERLLGVSLNGIFDNRFMSGLEYVRHGTYQTDAFVIDGVKQELPQVLGVMRDVAVATNKDWADRIGINSSAAITTVKPEGNNSNLVDCSSSMHGRHAKNFYIRTNRANKVDTVASYMITQGVYTEESVASDAEWVMFFPISVPVGAITREDYSAIEHLEIWLLYQKNYCEHKPSVTVSYKDNEALEVGGWAHKNFDWLSGIAFLPFDGGNYKQAPYITCTRTQWEELKAKTPKSIDFTKMQEDNDYTEAAKELACMGGMCEI